jgi:uncharacterized protein YbjT (DUF2867 family)
LGGTGNISRAIVNLLLSKGEDVTIFNRGTRSVKFIGEVKIYRGIETTPHCWLRLPKRASMTV